MNEEILNCNDISDRVNRLLTVSCKLCPTVRVISDRTSTIIDAMKSHAALFGHSVQMKPASAEEKKIFLAEQLHIEQLIDEMRECVDIEPDQVAIYT